MAIVAQVCDVPLWPLVQHEFFLLNMQIRKWILVCITLLKAKTQKHTVCDLGVLDLHVRNMWIFVSLSHFDIELFILKKKMGFQWDETIASKQVKNDSCFE